MTDRVRQEVGIHSRLKHPSILELYTFFEDNNYVYIVLELAHNGTLHKYMSEHQTALNECEAASLIIYHKFPSLTNKHIEQSPIYIKLLIKTTKSLNEYDKCFFDISVISA